jgi:hypothetical protein
VRVAAKGNAMLRGWLMLIGTILTVAGVVFALQGFGVLGGSSMSGSHFWAGAGPVLAIAGLILLAVSRRVRSGRSRV